MIHPDTEVRPVDPIIGVGVFATATILRGTIVWTQCVRDAVHSPAEYLAMGAEQRQYIERFGYRDPAGDWVVCFDAGRQVNHACEPTIRGVGPWMMVAVRDLFPGDEITCDYAECNLDPALSCHCGATSCRGAVHATDLLRYGEQWDMQLPDLLEAMRRVPQPLWPHLLHPAQVEAWLANQVSLPRFAEHCVFGSA